jgi:MoxR-like ATPase
MTAGPSSPDATDTTGAADTTETTETTETPRAAETAAVRETIARVREEVGKVVVGNDGAVTGMLAALLVGGHVLVEGVPGTAKTLLAKTVAATLSLDSARVQFTPDLMPSDVTGQMVFHADSGDFAFRPGPVFTNVLIGDEINRTPAKTQAALLEAMQERQVTVEGQARELPKPFIVVATQNPVEYEGTYPLPEAQLDRFLFKLVIHYPSAEAEREVVVRHHQGLDPHDLASAGVQAVANADHLAAARAAVAAIDIDEAVIGYLVDVVRATRDSPSLVLGVSPRGSTMLLHAAKAWAFLSGRGYVTPDEVKAVVPPTLRHRVLLRPEVELEGATADGILRGILDAVPVPR